MWEEKSEIADDEIQTLPWSSGSAATSWMKYLRSVTKFKSNFFDGIRKALVKRNILVAKA